MPQPGRTDSRDPLWTLYRANGDQDARRQLVERYTGLVKYVAGRMAVGLPHHLEFPDLYGAGLVGLIQAIDHFEPERGIKFETYSIPRIRGAILDELRAQDWFPRSLRRKARRLEETYAELETKLGRTVSDEEVATALGISLDELDRLASQIAVATIVSLDGEVPGEDDSRGNRIMDTLVDTRHRQPEDQLAEAELREIVAAALGELAEKDRLVLTLYYYEELTLREIGKVLEVTESRVCQIHARAVMQLRGKIHRRIHQKPLRRLGQEVARARRKSVPV
jgi:RNA polymerase sigma factor for flagellar operon FliA